MKVILKGKIRTSGIRMRLNESKQKQSRGECSNMSKVKVGQIWVELFWR